MKKANLEIEEESQVTEPLFEAQERKVVEHKEMEVDKEVNHIHSDEVEEEEGRRGITKKDHKLYEESNERITR